MDTSKTSLLETMERVSKITGAMAGKIVVCGKEIADYAITLAIGKPVQKPGPSTKTTKSTKNKSKTKNDEIGEKKVESRQTGLNKKKEKPKPSRSEKIKADEKTEIIAIPKKRRSPVSKKKKINVKTGELSAKN
jgi:hypothetical protein